jgi:hypothetical protein
MSDIQDHWNLALEYLTQISPKCISAERCLKVLEVMHTQIIEASSSGTSPEMHDPPTSMSFQPTPPLGLGHAAAGAVDWNMQDLVWNNLPWDWDLVDDLLVDGRNNGADESKRSGRGLNEE